MEADLRLSFVAGSQSASNADGAQAFNLKSAAVSDNRSFEKTLNDKRNESALAKRETENAPDNAEKSSSTRKNDKKADLKPDADADRRREKINSRKNHSAKESAQEKNVSEKAEETPIREGGAEKSAPVEESTPDNRLSENAAREAAEKIAEVLDISPEELQSALDKLGLSIEQLEGFENVKKLMMELHGVTDAAGLLKIPNLLETQKAVSEIAGSALASVSQQAAAGEGTQAAQYGGASLATQGEQTGEVTEDLHTQENIIEENAVPVETADVKDEKQAAKTKTDVNAEESKEAQANAAQNTLTSSEAESTPAQAASQNTEVDGASKINSEASAEKTAVAAADEIINGASAKTSGENTEVQDETAGTVVQADKNASSTANQNSANNSGSRQAQSGSQNAGTALKSGEAPAQNSAQQETGINATFSAQKSDEASQAAAKAPQSASRFTLEQSKDILNQLADKMRLDLKPGVSELKINLRPADLGNVTVKVITESGHVTAEIVTENSKVKELVEENLHTLKDALKQQGVDVGELSVSVGQQEQEEKMKQFMGEQTKSRARMSQILGRIVNEDGDTEPVNYADKSQINGSTVNYSA